MNDSTLNGVCLHPKMRHRYEVWFLRLGLADGTGAWWFRCLTMNMSRSGCPGNPRGMPVQIWATWFPRGGSAQLFIQGFPIDGLSLSGRGAVPFHFAHGENRIAEDSCTGKIKVDGHEIRWDLRYHSSLAVTMSDRGWIGFSRAAHSDAIFSGEIGFDGRTFRTQLLGYGLQRHDSGYRHRRIWSWTHCLFVDSPGSQPSTFEALEYEMPLGMRYRKAVVWTTGKLYAFGKFENCRRDRENLRWTFDCANRSDKTRLGVSADGSGSSRHQLPYLKTDYSGIFDVSNNSLACATPRFEQPGQSGLDRSTDGGTVLEMTGE